MISCAVLKVGTTFAAWGMLPRFALAGGRDPRFVFVVLRGALDGLAAVPPVGDPDYTALRGHLAIPSSGEGAALCLDDVFALNPNMAVIVAIGVNSDGRARCSAWTLGLFEAETS